MPSMDQSAPPAYETHPAPKTVNNGLTKPPAYHLSTSQPIMDQDSPVEALAIPTAGPALSSSFPYHPSLADFNISPSDWSLFTADLQAATAPTKGQKALAMLGSIGLCVVVGAPWASPCVWRWILRKQVIGSVKKGLTEDEAGSGKTESVAAALKRWNAAWADKGVVLGLEVSEKGLRKDESVVVEDTEKAVNAVNDVKRPKKCDGREKCRSEQKGKCCGDARYFRVVIQKIGDVGVKENTDEKSWIVVSELEDEALE